MSESGPTNEAAAEAVVRRRRGVSPIWLIPIVVMLTLIVVVAYLTSLPAVAPLLYPIW